MTNLCHRLAFLMPAAALCALTPVAFGQEAQALTAREIFYAPAPAPKPAAAKPVKTAQRAPKAAASNAAAPAQTPAIAKTPDAPVTSAPVSAARPASGPVTQVSLAALTRKPLGIRLSVLKIGAGGQTSEVAPDTNFLPGDRVRLSIQVSDNGYLYIINRGSSGTWTQLFPSPDLPNASNVVVPGVTYSIPPDRNFVVSNPPGEEKLFLILSRTPELDVQALTMDMSRREAQGSTPANEPSLPPHKPLETTIATNLPPMNDAMVEQMRHAYARDLIIEKVDDQTPGTRKENAVYAVNPGDGNDTRVVLDAHIRHQ